MLRQKLGRLATYPVADDCSSYRRAEVWAGSVAEQIVAIGTDRVKTHKIFNIFYPTAGDEAIRRSYHDFGLAPK
jgi:hypothetical protein